MIKHIKTVIYFAIIVGLILYLYQKREEFEIFFQIDPLYLFLLFIFHIVPFYILGLIFKVNISLFNLKLNFIEWFGITISNTMFNYILPFWGGAATKALYMKKKYNFSYANYTSYLSGFYLINFTISSLVAVLIGWYLVNTTNINSSIIFILLAILTSLVTVLLVLYKFQIEKFTFKRSGKIYNFINNCISGIRYFTGSPKRLFLLVTLLFAFTIIMGIRLYLAYTVLGFQVSIVTLLFVQSIVSFSRLVALTPGNLGVREGIIGLSSGLMGLSFDQALLGAILDRLVAMLIVFALGLIFSRILLVSLPSPESKRTSSSLSK